MTEQSEINVEAVVNYGGLSNAELMLVYFRMKKYVDNMEENLKNNKVAKQMHTPLGLATAYMTVPAEHVERFRKTEYYKLANSVVEKLGPLVELIMECDESLKKLADELR